MDDSSKQTPSKGLLLLLIKQTPVAFLYNTAIYIYILAIHIASLSNRKARLWINGRKQIFDRLKKTITNDSPLTWVHCASLGEFEQARPLIEEIKSKYPSNKILLTFFSPSGYEIRKNYEGADYVFYLPADTPYNAKRFITYASPTIAIFVKYEFWFNYQRVLKKNNIPLFAVSAIFRDKHHFFKWYGNWFKKNLSNFTHIFVQNEYSKQLLAKAGIKDVTVSGDTRFDRVAAITAQVKKFPSVELFCNGQKVFIAGSSWKPDEDILIPFINENPETFKYIIAPHEVHKEHIESICKALKTDYVLYSKLNEGTPQKSSVLIIDCIGILSHIYQYGYITYIGGGFGKSIHNILEPATFGMPVIFGPNHTKFAEAVALIKAGGAFTFDNAESFRLLIGSWTASPEKAVEAAIISRNFVKQNTGACKIIMDNLSSYL